jgi:hypothetical protein
VPVVLDFVGEACYSDSDRGHGNKKPEHDGSPPEFGVRDNPDAEGDYADRDQICGETFHARSSRCGHLSFPRNAPSQRKSTI